MISQKSRLKLRFTPHLLKGAGGYRSKILEIVGSIYFLSKFVLLSAPFYRIEKSFTVGPKRTDTFWSVLFDAFILKNGMKTKKIMDFRLSKVLQTASMYWK